MKLTLLFAFWYILLVFEKILDPILQFFRLRMHKVLNVHDGSFYI